MSCKQFIAGIVVLGCVGGLAGCGSAALDAKNGDTLQASVQALGADMSEAERATFGQDFIAVAEHAMAEDRMPSLSRLYSDDYTYLFRNDPGALSEGLYAEIALEAGERLDGMTAKSLHAAATDVRRDVLRANAIQSEERAEEAMAMIEAVRDTSAQRQAELDAAKAAEVDNTAQRDTAIGNLRLTWKSYTRGQTRPSYDALADVTNHAAVPVKGVNFVTTATFPDQPGHSLRALLGYVELDPPLAPGETRKDVAFPLSYIGLTSVSRLPDAKRINIATFLNAPHRFENLSANFEHYRDTANQRVRLELDRETQRALQGNARIIEACATVAERLQDAAAVHRTRAQQLMALSETPADTLDTLTPTPRLSRNGC